MALPKRIINVQTWFFWVPSTDFSQQAYEDTTTVLPVLLCDAHFSLSFVLKSSFLLFDSVIFVAFLNSTFDIVQKKQCQRLVYDANKGLLPRIHQRKRRKRRRGCDSFLLFFPFFLLRDGSDSSWSSRAIATLFWQSFYYSSCRFCAGMQGFKSYG